MRVTEKTLKAINNNFFTEVTKEDIDTEFKLIKALKKETYMVIRTDDIEYNAKGERIRIGYIESNIGTSINYYIKNKQLIKITICSEW
jgi:hypothetical protein